ncbi:MAG: hypothetical protein HY704_11465 [Gemmatimonadetes bacterium]|nr:hypothetical protein [Gemmatimonadota bacterium]
MNRTAPADTARGTIAVVGAIPYPSVVLEPSAGRFPLTLTGEHVASLEQLSGLEVWVAGTLDPDRRELRATAFAVRAANGVPAVDGRLALAGDSLVLVTTDGARRRIRHPPAALRELVGAHVWIAGQPDAEPLAFGLIRRSP